MTTVTVVIWSSSGSGSSGEGAAAAAGAGGAAAAAPVALGTVTTPQKVNREDRWRGEGYDVECTFMHKLNRSYIWKGNLVLAAAYQIHLIPQLFELDNELCKPEHGPRIANAGPCKL